MGATYVGCLGLVGGRTSRGHWKGGMPRPALGSSGPRGTGKTFQGLILRLKLTVARRMCIYGVLTVCYHLC